LIVVVKISVICEICVYINLAGLEDGLILTDNEYDDMIQDGICIHVRPIWFWMLSV